MTSVYEDRKQRAPRPLGLQAAFFPTRKWWKSQTLLTGRCPGSSLWAFVLVSCEVSGAGTLTLQGMLIEGGFSLFPEAVAMPTADNKVRRNLETQLGQKQRGFPSPAPFPEVSISPVPAQSHSCWSYEGRWCVCVEDPYLRLGFGKMGMAGGGQGQGGPVGVIRVIPNKEHWHGWQLPFPTAPP